MGLFRDMAAQQQSAISALEDKKMAAVVCLDQKAAFDLVDHQVLPAKMEVLHFSPYTFVWFRSYLGGR